MTLTLATRLSTAAMAFFVVLTSWQATLTVPGLTA
jgi:hypothetical protein